MRITLTVAHLNPSRREATIYEALKAKLGREPTHHEICDDVRRILAEGTAERAAQGKLNPQRKR